MKKRSKATVYDYGDTSAPGLWILASIAIGAIVFLAVIISLWITIGGGR